MKIAIPTENNEVFQHFGKCAQFTVYDVDNGLIKHKKLLSTEGSGHSALAAFLLQNGVEVVICGGIGAGAKNMLDEAGIKLASRVTGNVDTVVSSYLLGSLSCMSEANCNHHGDGEREHVCNCHNH